MRTVASAVLLALTLLAAPAPGLAGDDCEFWTDLRVKGAIADKVAFVSTATVRHDDGAGRHYYTSLESGLEWTGSSFAKLGLNYAHLNTRSGGRWALECRPSGSITLSLKPGCLSLSNRNLFELRVKESATSWRYRNKLTVTGPKLGAFKLRPYVAGELFWNISDGDLEKRRAHVGARVQLTPSIDLDACYVREGRNSGDDWTDVNVCATKFTYSF